MLCNQHSLSVKGHRCSSAPGSSVWHPVPHALLSLLGGIILTCVSPIPLLSFVFHHAYCHLYLKYSVCVFGGFT